jgi:hypothetical protein
MPTEDEVSSRLHALEKKIDANTELTQCVSRKMDVHAESHKAIEQHMSDVRRVLFEKDGVLDQVRDCKNFRAGQDKIWPAWSGWIAAIGGIIAGVAVVAQVLVMIFHK